MCKLAWSITAALTIVLAVLVYKFVVVGEVTLEVPAAELEAAMRALRDRPELRFETLIDVCGVDYSTYANRGHEGPRYAAVYHRVIAATSPSDLRQIAARDDACSQTSKSNLISLPPSPNSV